ncbi:UPF0182 family protein [Mumia zhuanghuii]|uniref:UPF0182 protein FHE65_20940 n=1 Tax=Mumia zhuanghuii TaxID=2585211 RepID=A0A5C4MIY7_9ACTN|nr:UPF0182 family protein [Mumia zhuanghuii]TNC33996.1 UPF0182 family protein [Mumia zhuanghuii]TNC42493.1 UPF0182 family protein [Mumia zhuanghuii]
MSEGSAARPRPDAGRQGRRVLIPTIITLVALLFLGAIFTGVWTDRLWFRSVDYGSVFSTMLSTRVLMFAGFGLLFAGVVLLNIYIAYRCRPTSTGPMRPNDPVLRYREAIHPLRTIGMVALGVLLLIFAGSSAAGQWRTFLMWRNATDFDKVDPTFGLDISFFVFDYPWLRFLTAYGFALLIVSGLAVAFVYYVYGGIAISGKNRKISRATQTHLSIIIGLIMLLKAFAYWLDRFGFSVDSNNLLTGITYTDANARIPSKNILIAVSLLCALLFFANAVWQNWLLPGISLALLVLTSVLIGGIWPAIMQSFQVKPSEPDKEAPYIERNIEATRDAYGIADVQKQDYNAQTSLTPQQLTESAESRVSTRLLDPTLVSPAFEQLQQVRGYYSVPPTLDVDRYTIDGSDNPQDIVIAARELNLEGLPENQRNWANDHTVYTHGYGVIAARGNQRGAQGQPVWVERDIPPVGELNLDKQPRIYFGENSPAYSIVGRPEGDDPIEVDIPRGNGDGEGEAENATQNTYDGKGGVSIGSAFRKMLYAVKFSEPNIVLSNRVNENSKILYDRHPRDRVAKVAPWLTIDGDPYPAVVDGKVVWIIDGYTTSSNYPYSEKVSLDEATSDTLTGTGAQAVLPSDRVNYMRNAVKAVVDAYDGSVDLYQWDTEDPVLKTWMKVFPGTVKPKAEISEDLLQHLRYPVDLFKVQRNILGSYHVTNPQTFYEGGERWKIPEDPTAKGSLQPPYYLSIQRPGEGEPRFSLTSVYLPNNRQNLASFVSVNSEASDPDGYGKIQILQLGSASQVDGPNQIANNFEADSRVSSALLPFKQAGTKVQFGNLLTLPVGEGLLYVQPVYIRRNATEGSYPVLQFVIASFGESIGFGQDLDEALRVALGIEGAPTPAPDEETPDEGDGGQAPTPQTVEQLLEQADAAYDAAQKALEAGNLGEYQRQVEEMATILERVRTQVGQTATPDAG